MQPEEQLCKMVRLEQQESHEPNISNEQGFKMCALPKIYENNFNLQRIDDPENKWKHYTTKEQATSMINSFVKRGVISEPRDPNFFRDQEYHRKLWRNGSTIKYYYVVEKQDPHQTLLSNIPHVIKIVEQAFKVWKDVGINLNFQEVKNKDESHLRIGFVEGDGSWSLVGTDNDLESKTFENQLWFQNLKRQFKGKRTMNIGWDTNWTRATAIHEIGHALGFYHEHQHPERKIVFNERNLFNEMKRTNGWDSSQTYFQILRQIPKGAANYTEWDGKSIMQYPFSASVFLSPEQYRRYGIPANYDLSELDKSTARSMYPLRIISRDANLQENVHEQKQIEKQYHVALQEAKKYGY